MSASWYDVLGVDPDASTDEIRAAWRRSIEDLEPTDRRFAMYNEAAGVLLDDDRRAAYDAELAPAAGAEDRADAPQDAGAEDQTGAPSGDDAHATAAAAPATGRAGRQWPRVPGMLLAGLAVVALLAAAGAAWLQFFAPDAEAREAALDSARSAAESSLPKVFTYDHRFPDRDHDQAARVLTGDLKEEYARLWDEVIEPNLARTKGTASSDVLGSAIVGGDADEAEILVVLKTVTGNAKQTQQLTLALTATMVQEDGVWRISALEGWDPSEVTDQGDDGSGQEDGDQGSGTSGSGSDEGQTQPSPGQDGSQEE